MVGAALWDIYSLVREHDPKDVALAFDIRHATVEGGLSWPVQFNLVKSHIGAAYFKDFTWDDDKVKSVPLGTGRVDRKYAPMLKASGFVGPISVHVEYGEGSKDKAFVEAFGRILRRYGVVGQVVQGICDSGFRTVAKRPRSDTLMFQPVGPRTQCEASLHPIAPDTQNRNRKCFVPQPALSNHTLFGFCSTFFPVVNDGDATLDCCWQHHPGALWRSTPLFKKEFDFHPSGRPQNGVRSRL